MQKRCQTKKRGDEILAEEEVVISPGVTKREDVEILSPIPTPED